MLKYKGRLAYHSHLLPWEDLLEVLKAKDAAAMELLGEGGHPTTSPLKD